MWWLEWLWILVCANTLATDKCLAKDQCLANDRNNAAVMVLAMVIRMVAVTKAALPMAVN
jgi:hypothetical protein